MNYVKNFFIVVGLFILSQVSMTVFGVLKGMSLASGQAAMSSVNTLILILITVANIVLLMWLAKKLSLCEFTFDWINKKNVLMIAVLYFAGRIVAIGGTYLGQLVNGQETTANDAIIDSIFSGESSVLLFLLIAVSAPIMEEIVFRGGIMGLLFKNQPFIGMAVSSIVFGLIHTATTFIDFMLYALLGLIMAYPYYKTKRLEVSIAVHFVNNAISAIAMILMMQ
ncbi:CPBP family intramembrane glutamic endopeptidase [Enterococcus sp. LJL51]|uniref:CPBP family intramembrane glutamic endopeptidase n=1 Tax=Enterococcus sp. LJL51 TaxID=3416656 RepID=UPI003CE86C0C